jgi:hypothetical protein
MREAALPPAQVPQHPLDDRKVRRHTTLVEGRP